MARHSPTAPARPLKKPASRLPASLLGALLALSLAANAGLLWRRAAPPAAPAATVPAPAAEPPAGAPKQLPAELRAYAGLGTYVAATNRIPDLGWTEEQFAAFAEGLRACYAGRPYPFDDDARRLREEINQRVEAMLGSVGTDPVEQYFALLREREGVQRTDSNLHYRITDPGAGEPPAASDTVVLSYAARLPSGESVPSLTRARVRVQAGDLLPGLSEGVQLLQAGGKALVYVPPSLSFADGPWPPEVPRGTPVAFFVELHEVVRDDW